MSLLVLLIVVLLVLALYRGPGWRSGRMVAD